MYNHILNNTIQLSMEVLMVETSTYRHLELTEYLSNHFKKVLIE